MRSHFYINSLSNPISVSNARFLNAVRVFNLLLIFSSRFSSKSNSAYKNHTALNPADYTERTTWKHARIRRSIDEEEFDRNLARRVLLIPLPFFLVFSRHVSIKSLLRSLFPDDRYESRSFRDASVTKSEIIDIFDLIAFKTTDDSTQWRQVFRYRVNRNSTTMGITLYGTPFEPYTRPKTYK